MSTIDTSNPLTESEVTELATIITLSHGARVVRYIDGRSSIGTARYLCDEHGTMRPSGRDVRQLGIPEVAVAHGLLEAAVEGDAGPQLMSDEPPLFTPRTRVHWNGIFPHEDYLGTVVARSGTIRTEIQWDNRPDGQTSLEYNHFLARANPRRKR
jgi:hypothetical protein